MLLPLIVNTPLPSEPMHLIQTILAPPFSAKDIRLSQWYLHQKGPGTHKLNMQDFNRL